MTATPVSFELDAVHLYIVTFLFTSPVELNVPNRVVLVWWLAHLKNKLNEHRYTLLKIVIFF